MENLKIVEDQEIDDKIAGIFPGISQNSNARKYKTERKLLPQDDYPAVQVRLQTIVIRLGEFYDKLLFSLIHQFVCCIDIRE